MSAGPRLPPDVFKRELGHTPSLSPYVEDVFSDLSKVLFKRLHDSVLFELMLTSVVLDEFLAVRDLLIERAYPNFSSKTKLRLVMDEAPILSD